MLLQLFLNVLFFFSPLSVSESVHSSPLLTFTPQNKKKRCRKSQTSPKTADLLSFLWFSSVLHQTPFLMQSQRGFLSVAGIELNVLTTTPLEARWNVSQPWATPYFFRLPIPHFHSAKWFAEMCKHAWKYSIWGKNSLYNFKYLESQYLVWEPLLFSAAVL